MERGLSHEKDIQMAVMIGLMGSDMSARHLRDTINSCRFCFDLCKEIIQLRESGPKILAGDLEGDAGR